MLNYPQQSELMQKKQLSIRLHGIPVGILEQLPTGKMQYTYHEDAKTAISINMPVRTDPYSNDQCEAYFGGLLPESDSVRKIIGQKFGISPYNTFSLLNVIGYDCAGAISCHEMTDEIMSDTSVPITGNILQDDALYTLIQNLPNKPLLIDVVELRLSLAGAQDKTAICLIDNQIAIPTNGCPTTHILKPQSLRFDGLVQNEYFIMKIAKRIGLNVPKIELRQVKEACFLLIERYDRHIHENYIARIHQEDFCQALGVRTIDKYQSDGGPRLLDCFNLLNLVNQPAIDRNQLSSIAVFNYLIGNMDAHGKNFSLLHPSSTNTKLAPFYDLICTTAYSHLSNKMAMKIGREYGAERVGLKDWQVLCEEINYRYLAIAELIESMKTKIIAAALQEREQLKLDGMYHPIIDVIINKFQAADLQ
jgi:serine/threonine-protein kinase HipA